MALTIEIGGDRKEWCVVSDCQSRRTGGKGCLLPEELDLHSLALEIAIREQGHGLVRAESFFELPHHFGASGCEHDLDAKFGTHAGEPISDALVGKFLGHRDHGDTFGDCDRGGNLPVSDVGQGVDHPLAGVTGRLDQVETIDSGASQHLGDPARPSPKNLCPVAAVGDHHRIATLGLLAEDAAEMTLRHRSSA